MEYKDSIKFKKKPIYKSNNIKDIHLTIMSRSNIIHDNKYDYSNVKYRSFDY